MLKDLKEVDLNSGTVVVDFYADWCGPCQRMGPIFEKLAEEFDVPFVKINVDENSDLAAKYRIKTIPAFFVLKNGEPTRQNMGSTSEDLLRNFFKEDIGS